MRNKPFSVHILVSDGDPDGIRVIEQPNWSGTGVAFPCAFWENVRDRGLCEAAGVYILVSESTDLGGLPLIVIGGGAPLEESIAREMDNPEPWTWGVAFTSGNDSLGPTHIRRIVTDLWRRAACFGRCRVKGGADAPDAPVTQREDVEVGGFMDEMLRLMPLLGMHFFTHPKKKHAPA